MLLGLEIARMSDAIGLVLRPDGSTTVDRQADPGDKRVLRQELSRLRDVFWLTMLLQKT